MRSDRRAAAGLGLAALALTALSLAALFRFWHPHPLLRVPVAVGAFLLWSLAAAFALGAARGRARR
jgi:hypothetical protein